MSNGDCSRACPEKMSGVGRRKCLGEMSGYHYKHIHVCVSCEPPFCLVSAYGVTGSRLRSF